MLLSLLNFLKILALFPLDQLLFIFQSYKRLRQTMGLNLFPKISNLGYLPMAYITSAAVFPTPNIMGWLRESIITYST